MLSLIVDNQKIDTNRVIFSDGDKWIIACNYGH